jgi:hypothetical protein
MTAGADDTVSTGRAAWQRLRDRERATWADWLAVGRALIIGRAAAMQEAKANRPLGSKYNRLFGAWLRSNGFDTISTQERYRIVLCIENLTTIEEWRKTLDNAKKRTLNHPGAVWHAWRGSIKAETPRPAQRQQVVFKRVTAATDAARQGRAIYWPQDAMRRAHQAMLDSRSHDLLILARAALQAAIRNEGDLLALLPAPQTTSTPRRNGNAVQAEETARAPV